MQIDPNTGRQFTFCNGHLAAAWTAPCLRVPGMRQRHGIAGIQDHSLRALTLWFPRRQRRLPNTGAVQCYMNWAGLERALYIAVCKDDDRLHLERIDADKTATKA